MKTLQLAFRNLARHKSFSLIVILVLALGMAGSTSVFSVVNRLVLQPLEFEEPERLLHVQSSIPRRGVPEFAISLPEYEDYRARSSVFEDIAAFYGAPETFNLDKDGEPVRLVGRRVTANFFSVLGVNAALGRTFLAVEQGLGTTRVAVITDRFWRSELGADPAVLGQTLFLNEIRYEIVGVLPADFSFQSTAVQAFLPLEVDFVAQSRRTRQFRTVGRLREGETLESARRDIGAIATALQDAYPDSNADFEANVVPLYDYLYGETFSRTWAVALAAALSLLAIALGNVVNLQVTRATLSQGDLVTRRALGASLRQAVAPIAAEGALLVFLGCGVGVGLSYLWGVPLVSALLPADLPRTEAVSLDLATLLFASALAAAAAGLASLLPATFVVMGRNLEQSLRDSRRAGASRSAAAVHGGLIVVGVSLTFGLLLAAGMFIRSAENLGSIDRGIEPSGVLAIRLTAPQAKYPEPVQIIAHIDRIVEKLAALPSIESAAAINELPASGYINWGAQFVVDGRPPPPAGQESICHARIVGPRYFQTMGITLLAGRDFSTQDGLDQPRVIVVNEILARQHFARDPVGEFLSVKRPDGFEKMRIVGVVEDVRQAGAKKPIRPGIYFPYTQRPTYTTSIVLRTGLPTASIVPSVRSAVAAVDNRQAIYSIETVEEALAEEAVLEKALARLLAVLVVAGTLLSAAGLYGVVAHTTARRTHEIAIRMAVGADRRQILTLVLRRGIVLTAAGLVIGLALWTVSSPALAPLLFGVDPFDAGIVAGVCGLVVAVSLLASWVPARRATAIQPVRALRAL